TNADSTAHVGAGALTRPRLTTQSAAKRVCEPQLSFTRSPPCPLRHCPRRLNDRGLSKLPFRSRRLRNSLARAVFAISAAGTPNRAYHRGPHPSVLFSTVAYGARVRSPRHTISGCHQRLRSTRHNRDTNWQPSDTDRTQANSEA